MCHQLSFLYRGQKKFICSSCSEENIVANCFRDKAVEYELRNTTLKCLNQSCPWEGESRFYQVIFSFVELVYIKIIFTMRCHDTITRELIPFCRSFR